MKVPIKVLYQSYLPPVKDRTKILMADNGLPIKKKNLLSSVPDEYLNNLDTITNANRQPENIFADYANSQMYGKGPTNFSNPNLLQPNTDNFHQPNVAGSVPQQIDPNGYLPINPGMPPPNPRKQPYEGQIGQAIVTGASLFDAVLPYGKINHWPTVRPNISPNQHPYGTGSQALMEYGGDIEQAKSGNWIKGAVNPKHKGYCTPMTKSTCTPRRKAFAMTMKKHHGFHEDGGVLEMPDGGKIKKNSLVSKTNPISETYGNRYVAFPYGQSGAMPTTNTVDLQSATRINSPNQRGYVNTYNTINQFGDKGVLNDEQIPAQYLTGKNPNNFGLQTISNNKRVKTDSVYVAPGANESNVHIPYGYGGKIEDYAYSGIHIKPSKVGSLHKHLGIAKDKKIPASALSIKPGDSPAIRKKKQFAINAKKWHHEYGGTMEDGGPISSGPITYPADHLGATWNGKKFTYPVIPNRPHRVFKSGGTLSPAKAAEILHDGTAQGHLLTDKQRRFMGWKAHQKADFGIDIPPTGGPTGGTTNQNLTPHNRTDAYLVDDINQTLTTGMRTKNTGYGPEQQQMLNDAYMWRQANNRTNNPTSNIEGYFNRPVDPNNPTSAYRGRLRTIGHGAVSMYNSTPNQDVQAALPNLQSHLIAGMENGGVMEENNRMWRMYDDGGAIDTHWGGNATPIAYNPYDGGTTQFNGDSHDNGGIGMSYNGKQVEVEGGETAAKDQDGNLNIFGNMYLPGTKTKFKTAVKEIGEKEKHFDKLKTTGTTTVNELDPKNRYDQIKFNAAELMMKGGDIGQKQLAGTKQQLADLQNAMLDTAKEFNLDPQGMSAGNIKKAKKGTFIKAASGLKMYDDGGDDPNAPTRSDRNNNPGNIKMPAKAKYKKLLSDNGRIPLKADKDGFLIFPDRNEGSAAMTRLLRSDTYKNTDIDSAIHTWTDKHPYDYNLPSDIKGKKVGDLNDTQLESLKGIMSKGEGTKYGSVPNPGTFQKASPTPGGSYNALPPFTPYGLPQAPEFSTPTPEAKPNQPINPRYNLGPIPNKKDIPTQAKPLGFNDVASDIFAIAQNQERPVYAQKYTPELYEPYQVSFQDRINANQNSFNNISRIVDPSNPAALGALGAQKYEADNSVRADEFRTNQGISNQVHNENVGLTNNAQLINLRTADEQFNKQDLAGSKTREMNQLIVNSLSDKYNAVKMRNNELKAYENLYKFRLQNNPKTGGMDETNFNPDQNFEYQGRHSPYTSGEGGGGNRRTTVYNPNGSVKNYRETSDNELISQYRELRNETMRRKLNPADPDNLLKKGGTLVKSPKKLFRAGYTLK